jgi:hypothetical protein
MHRHAVLVAAAAGVLDRDFPVKRVDQRSQDRGPDVADLVLRVDVRQLDFDQRDTSDSTQSSVSSAPDVNRRVTRYR